MDNEIEKPEDSKKIILIVGAVAVVVAIILLVALMPREPEVDPYVVQLEQEVSAYSSQIDSLNTVVDGMNANIDNMRSEVDSARAANRVLLSSLNRITGQLKEYKGLYTQQQALNKKLRTELNQVKTEKDRAIADVKALKSQVDTLNEKLYEKTVRLVRLESSLEEALEQAKSMKETVSSVLVYMGTEDELKEAGYLDTGRSFLFRKSFRAVGFPDVMDEQNRNQVLKVSIGQTLVLPGELDALADRHGKLSKGDEYEVSKGPPGQALITFVDSTLQGQRILAVLKKK